MNNKSMKQPWLRCVFPIAALFSFRMLGLFMLIPVFTVYANDLTDSTPTMIGIALGIYGLSQGLLQIPFGMLSDRLGRKPIITIGLILFAIGSLLGALTHSIYGMILARTLQGAGAIGSVLIALLADLTPDEQRTKAMAVIGTTIGLSFSLAMIISPAIAHSFGLSGIFYVTALFGVVGLFLLHMVVPTPTKTPFHMDSEVNPRLFKKVIKNKELQRLNLGIFSQHFILTSTFFALPMMLQQQILQGHLRSPWQFYLPLMMSAFLAMVPLIILAEKKRRIKQLFLSSIAITTISQGLLFFSQDHWVSLCVLMFCYFVAFNILEANLPSQISRQADADSKGTAMGVYSSSQFLGLFAGGALAGVIYEFASSSSIFIVNALMGLFWLLIAAKMNPELYQTTLIISYPPETKNTEDTIIRQLRELAGVIHVVVAKVEGLIYLHINKNIYRPGSAENLMSQSDLK